MVRKEINVYSVSFLDLLSGVLGAMLILFIIIPKMSSAEQQALQQLDELNVQSEQLADLIEQARNSIPTELYQQIQEQIDALQETVQQSRKHITEVEQENAQLRQQLAQAQQQLEEVQERLRKKDGLPSNLVDKGDMEVFILWEENVDVDLYVKNLDNGEICQQPSSQGSTQNVKNWGVLTEDINNERLRGDGVKYYEIFYQIHPIPGRYQIYFNIYDRSDGGNWNGHPATVSGFAVIHPGKPNEKRIDFKTVTLTRAMENHIVGILTVTNDNINLQQ